MPYHHYLLGCVRSFISCLTRLLSLVNMSITRSLPHLPFEILRQISGHLDKKTAASLARSCKGLRDAGELKLWETLDITSKYQGKLFRCHQSAPAADDRVPSQPTTTLANPVNSPTKTDATSLETQQTPSSQTVNPIPSAPNASNTS